MIAVPIVSSGGSELSASLDIVSVEVVREVNRLPYAQIVLSDGVVAKASFPALESDSLAPGAEIEIKARIGDDITSLFKGLISRVRLELSGAGPRIVLECKDKALRLTVGRRTVIYPDGSDSDAVSAVLRRAELEAGDLGSGETVPSLVQYDSTDWDFIVARAEASGSAVVVADGKVSLKPLDVSAAAVRTFKLGIDEIDDFELELDAGEQAPDLSAVGWDLPNGKVTEPAAASPLTLPQGNVDPAEAAAKLGLKDATLRHLVPMSSGELKSWASARLAQSRLAMFRGRIAAGGTGSVVLMDLIALEGFSPRFNGRALVTGLRHSLEGGDWRTDFRLGLSAEPLAERLQTAAPPAHALLPPARGLSVGLVSDYEADPNGEYRIRLSLPGVTGGEESMWARLAAPEAGSKRGFFFRPDPGDEVIVGFLAEDPRQPVVLGSLFGSKNAPPQAFADLSDKNIGKGLVTRHGIAVELKDEDGKPILSFKTPKSLITIDDDKGEIRLSDGNSNSITLGKDGIAIESGKDFKLKASGKVELKGASIDAN
jgi:phage protein D